MDGALILEFTNNYDAGLCLDVIQNVMADHLFAQGYDILETERGREFVGKNAATGSNELVTTRTVMWDVVRPSPVGTFYIASPRFDPRYIDGMDYIADYPFIEKPMPVSWLEDRGY